MMDLLLPWIAVLSILAYIPIVCYLDWKHRDIGTHQIWAPLIAVNIPVLIAGYYTGLYPIVMLPVSILFAMMWLYLAVRYRHGGDAWWLVWITTFVIINPVYDILFIQSFVAYLIIFTGATIWGIMLDNRLQKGQWTMETERGIPYIIVISVAFIAALVVA